MKVQKHQIHGKLKKYKNGLWKKTWHSIRRLRVQCLEIAFHRSLDTEYKHTTSNKTENKINAILK